MALTDERKPFPWETIVLGGITVLICLGGNLYSYGALNQRVTDHDSRLKSVEAVQTEQGGHVTQLEQTIAVHLQHLDDQVTGISAELRRQDGKRSSRRDDP